MTSSNQFLIFFIFFSFFVSPIFSFAQTQAIDKSALIVALQKQVDELTKQIQVLQKQLSVVQSELGASSSSTTPTEAPVVSPPTPSEFVPPEFIRNLSRGSFGEDVRKLQEFLAKDKEVYPEGLITGYFGPLTEIALKKWQQKYNIEAVGALGPQTRAKFTELGKGRIQELITEGAGPPAGGSGVIPPGFITVSGIGVSTTTVVTATTTPPKPDPNTCAALNNYCFGQTECSQNGWHWCRDSCYSVKEACTGQTFYVPPAQTTTTSSSQGVATSTIPSQTTSTTSSSGTNSVCLLQAEGFNLYPDYDASDVGVGYAQLKKPGVDYPAIKTACTSSDWNIVLTKFCSVNYGRTSRTGATTFNPSNGGGTTYVSTEPSLTMTCPTDSSKTAMPSLKIAVSNYSVNVTENSAVITFTTNISLRYNRVGYTKDGTDNWVNIENSEQKTNHSFSISNLASGTKYKVGLYLISTYNDSAQINAEPFTTVSSSSSSSTPSGTSTSNSNQNYALAQILESLKSILNSLKLLQ